MGPGWWRGCWTFCSGTQKMLSYLGTLLSSRWATLSLSPALLSWSLLPFNQILNQMVNGQNNEVGVNQHNVSLMCYRWCQCWTLMVWWWEITAALWQAGTSTEITRHCSEIHFPVCGTPETLWKGQHICMNKHEWFHNNLLFWVLTIFFLLLSPTFCMFGNHSL